MSRPWLTPRWTSPAIPPGRVTLRNSERKYAAVAADSDRSTPRPRATILHRHAQHGVVSAVMPAPAAGATPLTERSPSRNGPVPRRQTSTANVATEPTTLPHARTLRLIRSRFIPTMTPAPMPSFPALSSWVHHDSDRQHAPAPHRDIPQEGEALRHHLPALPRARLPPAGPAPAGRTGTRVAPR